MRVALHLYSDPSVSLASPRRWGFQFIVQLRTCAVELIVWVLLKYNSSFVMDLVGLGNTIAQMGLCTLAGFMLNCPLSFRKSSLSSNNLISPAPWPLPPWHLQGQANRKWVINSSTAQGLGAFMLLTFECINSRTIESELFLSMALNIIRESGRTIGSGLLGEVEISALPGLTPLRWAPWLFALGL